MGHGSFSSSSWDSFSKSTTAGKSTAHVFSARGLKDSMNPAKIALRESCDGPDNPKSLPIKINLDVTGSMGIIPDYFIRTGLPLLFKEIYDRKPGGGDPHIAFGGIGDVVYDRAPYQISQFEADIRIAQQLTDLFLEGGGGGNQTESYILSWFFAATRTKIDSIKRGKKGFLFTIGDEECPKGLSAAELEKVFGPGQYSDLTTEQLLEMVSTNWHVFHIVVEEGHHARAYPDRVRSSWNAVLGQNVIFLSDYTKLSEVIVSTIEAVEGKDADTIVKSWGGDTSLVVAKAIGGLAKTTKSGIVPANEAVAF